MVDGAINLFAPDILAKEMTATGFPTNLSSPLGVLILCCAAVYAFPRTRVLGAILVTGFLGGAICTHFRLGDIGSTPQIVGLVLGLAAWASLYLEHAQLRDFLPLCQNRRP